MNEEKVVSKVCITEEFKNEFITLKEYEIELKEDLVMKKDIKSLQNSILINKSNIAKWSTRKAYHKLDLAKYESSYIDVDTEARLKNTLIIASHQHILSDREVNKIINGDDRLQDLNYMISYIKVLIEFCDGAEKQLNGMSFDLGKLVDITLYQEGFNR